MDTGKPPSQVDEIWGSILVQRIAYSVVIWIHNHNQIKYKRINERAHSYNAHRFERVT